MSTLLQSKADLRKLALSRRNALSEEKRAEKSLTICKQVSVFLENDVQQESSPALCKRGLSLLHASGASRAVGTVPFAQAVAPDKGDSPFCTSHFVRIQKGRSPIVRRYIALYNAINSEVDLSPLANRLQQEGVTVLKPLMSDTEGHMEFVNWDEKLDPLSTVEASTIHFPTVPPEEIDIIICPVVAFDKRNNRLGYGGGYYDRYLPSLKSDTLKIGVAFSCQELDEIPIDDFDVPLDLMVTENS